MDESKEIKTLKKVRFIFDKPEDLKPIYINGIYGGMSPRGDLTCHFFYESGEIPKEEKVGIVEGKPDFEDVTRIERIEHEPTEIVYRREIRASLIIPVHQISSIANWMLDKLKTSKIIVEKEEKEG